MSEPVTKTQPLKSCPICGTALPAGLAPTRCPQCLLRVGLAVPQPPVLTETTDAHESLPETSGLPQPGSTFGHYQIVRLLGIGGMGAVFEAEDLECGRRVALKVLGRRLDSQKARSRFFREGRLAASISHPNSVYVYGTEEIAGIPVIAMELIAGGTLQDRVARRGPLSVAEAVDCVLQIIAGLEAAQRVGVLHRDVKPSNCMVEEDGTVKIGDFGLSISTRFRTEPHLTVSGVVMGTPAFSSPEQLRSDELTVRSDIYSVGVTLYYLLTGHHVFTAGNLVQLLAIVLERRPESPAKWRPQLPEELCRRVLRCLEKDPERRFRNYDELRAALLPYASTAPTPATLGRRVLAFGIDVLCLSWAQNLVGFILDSPGRQYGIESYRTPSSLLVVLGKLALMVVYFGLLEGWWGASAGKALCGLRVARLDRTSPGLGRAAGRAMIFLGLRRIPELVLCGVCVLWKVSLDIRWLLPLLSLSSWAVTALVFSTARRRNGFAAWHDLASGTRVIQKEAYQARPVSGWSEDAMPDTQAAPLVGPYHVLGKMGGTNGVELFLGFDTRLLRRVWIRQVPPGTPPVRSGLRQLRRPGRLRWLSGVRKATEAWDAYDAAPGKPLLSLITQRQSWSQVRYWLFDLAEELQAAEKEGSMPETLELDRVWITTEGRAKLLDFPSPGMEVAEPALQSNPVTEPPAPAGFLRCVARSSLEGRLFRAVEAPGSSLQVPLAMPARRYLESLKNNLSLADLTDRLRPLLARPATVSVARRVALLGASLALPLLIATISVVDSHLEQRFLQARPELASLRNCLDRHEMLQLRVQTGAIRETRVSDALEACIATRFAQVNTNQGAWKRFQTSRVIYGSQYQTAERIINTRSIPSTNALAEADAIVEQFFSEPSEAAALRSYLRINTLTVLGRGGYLLGLATVVLPCLLASLLFGGGLLTRVFGIAFVTRAGAPLSRWRLAGRNLVAWLPFLLVPIPALLLAPVVGDLGGVLLTEVVCVALGLVSALLPQRGLPDRITGTWPVPR